MKDSNVVFLAHRNDNVKTHYIEYLTCKNCQNKTWIVIYDESGDGFPVMRVLVVILRVVNLDG